MYIPWSSATPAVELRTCGCHALPCSEHGHTMYVIKSCVVYKHLMLMIFMLQHVPYSGMLQIVPDLQTLSLRL